MKRGFFLLVSLFICVLASAQEIHILSEQIPQQSSFAQPFDVRFELGHASEYVVELEKESLPENFELIQEKSEKLSPATQAFHFTFIPFTLGASTFTAITFQLKDRPSGKVLAQAQTSPQTIQIQPVQFYNEKTLRDIRPPYIPSNPLIWLLCAIAAGILFFILKRYRKKLHQDQLALQEQQDHRPADVIAYSKIQLLLQSGLWERKEYKLFYSELADILREYFWRRFGLDVSADTSAELLRRARNIAELTPILMPFREYLTSSDLVKFAQVSPTLQTMQQDVQVVQDLVRQTTPKPIVPKEESHV